MKKIKILSLILYLGLCFYASSCITNFNPLVTHDTITENDNIIGLWVMGKNELQIKKIKNSHYMQVLKDAEFSPRDVNFLSKLYVISLHTGNLNYYWIAGTVKIGNEEFINISADECVDMNNQKIYPPKDLSHEYNTSNTIAKLSWKNKNEVRVQFLNGNNIKNLVLQNKARIKHEYDPMFDSFLITASSEELFDFLVKYSKNQDIYDKKNTFTLIRKN